MQQGKGILNCHAKSMFVKERQYYFEATAGVKLPDKHFADPWKCLHNITERQQQHSDIRGCKWQREKRLTNASQGRGEKMSLTDRQPKNNTKPTWNNEHENEIVTLINRHMVWGLVCLPQSFWYSRINGSIDGLMTNSPASTSSIELLGCSISCVRG